MALEALVSEAAQNTWTKELHPLDIRTHTVRPGHDLCVVARDDSLYVPVAVMALGGILPDPLPAGAFVFVPRRDALAALPITGWDSLRVLPDLRQISASMASTARVMAFDSRVHWWDGRIVHAVEIADGDARRASVTGPSELIEALAGLA